MIKDFLKEGQVLLTHEELAKVMTISSAGLIQSLTGCRIVDHAEFLKNTYDCALHTIRLEITKDDAQDMVTEFVEMYDEITKNQ